MNLREFGSWAIGKDQLSNPQPNYKYAGECVSLIQQLLYNVFGIEFKGRGNAKDWGSNADVLSHFNKLPVGTALIAGDILVYGSNYGGGYGHIAFIDANCKYFDQNGIRSKHVGYRDIPFINYICVLRCKTPFKTGNEVISYIVRVDKEKAMVRSGANSQCSLAGSQSMVRGNTFVAVGTVQGENVGGNNIWYRSSKGNFVWSGGLTKI
jgi:hypothetical protein